MGVGHDFEVVSGGAQAVIALDEQTGPELEAHEPWESLEYAEDRGATEEDELWEYLESDDGNTRVRNYAMSYAEVAGT